MHSSTWEQAIAEGGEFFVLGAVAFDEVEEGGGGLVELLDEIRGREGDRLGGYYFGVHGWVGSAAGYDGAAVDVEFRGEAEIVKFLIDHGFGDEGGTGFEDGSVQEAA